MVAAGGTGVRYHESAGVVYSSVSYCNEYATMHVLSAEGARQVQIKTGRHAVLHDPFLKLLEIDCC